MMSLPALYGRPTDQESRDSWAFNHAAIHTFVANAVFTQKSVNTARYLLSTINPDSLGMWLYQHQTMHNQVNAVLFSRPGFDLLGLDWSDPDSFDEWLSLHGDEHQRWNTVLGV